MKTIRIAVLIGLVTTLNLSTQAEEKGAIKKDMAQLQGEWSMVSGSADGQPMPEDMRKEMKRVCQGDEVTVTMKGQIFIHAKIIIDPSKTPKTIDYQMVGGFTKGKTQLGIYELEGDTFKASFAKPGEARPTDFLSKAGESRTVSVWKREKKAAPESKEK
jgi:uncharacterized protein (TIGR03067 family)